MSQAERDPVDDVGAGQVGDDRLSERLDRLVEAVDELARQVEGLGARIDRLEQSPPRRARAGSGVRGRRRPVASESIQVVMRPIPELAMAAVAERALRKAEAVESVTKAESTGEDRHCARYIVEVRPDSDLIGEVGKTLPVAFSANEDEPGVVSFDLKW